MTHLRKGFEFGKVAKETKQLHGNAGRYHQQAHGKNNKAAELLTGTKNLVDKVLQHRRRLNESDHSENLRTKIPQQIKSLLLFKS